MKATRNDKAFWAYAVKDGNATLVRCLTHEDAIEEKDRMKWSDATTVGSTSRAVAEMEVRKYCRSRGWKVSLIRNSNQIAA